MKKISLLLSAMAVASTSFAVTPELNPNLSRVEIGNASPAIASRTVLPGEKVFAGKELNKSGKFAKKTVRKASELSISYVEPNGLFAMGLSYPSGYSLRDLSVRRGPAYKPLTWYNTSVGASEYEWEYIQFDSGEQGSSYVNTFDLEMTPIWSSIPAPILYGIDEEGNDDNFMLGGIRNDAGEYDDYNIEYLFGGSGEQRVSQTDYEDFGLSTYLYGYNPGYDAVPCTAYAPGEEDYNSTTGLYDVFTAPSPNGYGFSNPILEGYANVFDFPAAPYYITKMWCLLEVQAKVATTLEMNLFKIDDEGHLTDEIIASGSVSIQPTDAPKYGLVNFDLYTLDEDGLETDEPIVIDCAFLAKLTFKTVDLVTINVGTGLGATYKKGEKPDYWNNGLMVINADGDVNLVPCPYDYYMNEQGTELVTITDWMWMVDAVFPWMFEVNGQTVAQAPNEGGNVSYVINSYYDLTSLSLSFSDDPEWILSAMVDIDEDYNQIVTFETAALPEGVEGRTTVATIEGPAASIELTINQGEGNAVSIVAADKNAEYFDLAGRRVANPEKGIYIKKAGNKAEKVLF